MAYFIIRVTPTESLYHIHTHTYKHTENIRIHLTGPTAVITLSEMALIIQMPTGDKEHSLARYVHTCIIFTNDFYGHTL